MSKRAYIGVNGIARKIKKGYVGVETDVPIYGMRDVTATMGSGNIAEFFKVTNGSEYYFVGDGTIFTTNNYAVSSSTATTTLEALSDMSISFNYSYSSEKNFDKFTLVVAGTTVENAVSGATTSKSWSGTLTKGQTISFSYTKDGSGSNNDDKCTFSNMVVSTKKSVQIGTEQKDLARRIKKAYIGIGGVARPCWSGGELQYYGTISELSEARYSLSATTVGKYALFAGGYGTKTLSTVDAYDESLTKVTVSALSTSRQEMASTTIGNYALFAGGSYSDNGYDVVDTYDDSLTKISTPRLYNKRWNIAATTIGDYAIFAGGRIRTSNYSTVDAYDKSLTRSNPTSLSQERSQAKATTVGDYAIIAGGFRITSYDDTSVSGSHSSKVDAYDKSLTRTTPTSLSWSSSGHSSTTVGDYALFSGIKRNYTDAKCVDCYNSSLTKVNVDDLSEAKENSMATTVGKYALFAGGSYTSSGAILYTSSVDAYDSSLTHTITTELSQGRSVGAATTLGEYALIGGGRTTSNNTITSSMVDVYIV